MAVILTRLAFSFFILLFAYPDSELWVWCLFALALLVIEYQSYIIESIRYSNELLHEEILHLETKDQD